MELRWERMSEKASQAARRCERTSDDLASLFSIRWIIVRAILLSLLLEGDLFLFEIVVEIRRIASPFFLLTHLSPFWRTYESNYIS